MRGRSTHFLVYLIHYNTVRGSLRHSLVYWIQFITVLIMAFLRCRAPADREVVGGDLSAGAADGVPVC